MKNVYISDTRPFVIGRQGENQVTTIKFAINAFFPHLANASFTLLHQRANDPAPYPCAATVGEGFINWTINDADVSNAGSGTAQLTAYRGDGSKAKSVIFTTITLDSMGAYIPADPLQIWIDQVLEAGTNAIDSAIAALNDAERAAAAREGIEAVVAEQVRDMLAAAEEMARQVAPILRTEIPEGADLVAYTGLGTYYSPTADRTSTLYGLPDNLPVESFTLKVIEAGGLKSRVIYAGTASNPRLFMQNFSSESTYSDWFEVPMLGNGDSLNEAFEAAARGVVDSYGYTAAINEINELLSNVDSDATETKAQVRRSYATDPVTGEVARGIAISDQLSFTGTVQTVSGYEYHELSPNQTFGIYTASGWQFWVNGSKYGWFDGTDGSFHTQDLSAVTSLTVGNNWTLTNSGGLGIKYAG